MYIHIYIYINYDMDMFNTFGILFWGAPKIGVLHNSWIFSTPCISRALVKAVAFARSSAARRWKRRLSSWNNGKKYDGWWQIPAPVDYLIDDSSNEYVWVSTILSVVQDFATIQSTKKCWWVWWWIAEKTWVHISLYTARNYSNTKQCLTGTNNSIVCC